LTPGRNGSELPVEGRDIAECDGVGTGLISPAFDLC
jgi:hypothetical protein